ncbi:MAG: Fe-S cluster assembly protein SufD [Acidobacteria bacterium]|nr:Fe-S cluster assembly protein SufD [Acidobacteriota bacterium]
MAHVIQDESLYLSNYRELERSLGASEPAWLRRLREESIQTFTELGFPTTREEDWKYTNLAPVSAIPFQSAASESVAHGHPTLEDLESVLWVGSSHLVFVNGHYSEALSCIDGLPEGVKVRTLSAALEGEGDLQEHFARYAQRRRHALVALNTALWQDGAYVRIAKGTVLEKPIHLLFVSSSGGTPVGSPTRQSARWGAPVVSHPRILIVAERDTQSTFIESYFGYGGGVSFSNAVTEIVAGESSVIDHYKIQVENSESFHLATIQALQERSSSFATCSIALGARLARTEVGAVLDGEGADCTLNGLYLATDNQHVDNYTTVDHARPHGSSHQFYKGILDGQANAVFNGRIIVRQDAQKTDAIQKNKNLLLSEDAVVNTKPQLEIFANDVRCTHGATIGQIDPEALYYLRSRGIGRNEARTLLSYAFAGEILDGIRLAPIRVCLEGSLHARLADDISSHGGTELQS